MTEVVQFPAQEGPPDIRGPIRQGCAVIIRGRAVPNLHMVEREHSIDFILDNRLCFEFPKEWAFLAACFAGSAMAIGAGYPSLEAESRNRPFAPRCIGIEIPSGDAG